MLSASPSRKNSEIMIRFAADDPVGGLEHSFPIHPDQGSSKPQEYWEEQLHKKRPRKPVPKPSPETSRQDDHQIDDFA